MTLAEAPAPVGHNRPPPSPFESVKAHLDDLQTEARAWLDGAAIETQAQADELSRLMDDLRQGKKAADDARKTEAKPFDDGKAEVQARYNPLLKAADMAVDGCKAALTPWLKKKDDEARAAAEAARKAAEAKAAEAAEAMRRAAVNDLAAREAAEALLTDARKAGAAADRAKGLKGGAFGGARAATLRSYFSPVMTDGIAAARHYWVEQRAACEAFFLSLAEADVRSGKRQIPGFDVVEDRRPV